AAMHLALDDHVVDDAPDVVAARQRGDADLPGLAIDLHFARLGAVGPRWSRRRLGGRHPKQLTRLPPRQVAERDRAIGAGDAEAAVAVFDVRLRRLQRLCRQRPAIGNHPPTGGDDCRAADERGARADAADTVGAVGITLHDAHLALRHAEYLRDELGVRSLEALAHGLRP